MVTVCWAIYGHKHRERLQKPKANPPAKCLQMPPVGDKLKKQNKYKTKGLTKLTITIEKCMRAGAGVGGGASQCLLVPACPHPRLGTALIFPTSDIIINIK